MKYYSTKSINELKQKLKGRGKKDWYIEQTIENAISDTIPDLAKEVSKGNSIISSKGYVYVARNKELTVWGDHIKTDLLGLLVGWVLDGHELEYLNDGLKYMLDWHIIKLNKTTLAHKVMDVDESVKMTIKQLKKLIKEEINKIVKEEKFYHHRTGATKEYPANGKKAIVATLLKQKESKEDAESFAEDIDDRWQKAGCDNLKLIFRETLEDWFFSDNEGGLNLDIMKDFPSIQQAFNKDAKFFDQYFTSKPEHSR